MSNFDFKIPATDGSLGKTPVEMDGIELVHTDNFPIQIPGKHHRVRVKTYGGPESDKDRRLYLDQAQIEKWLDMCKHSLTRRVQLDKIGFRVVTWCDRRSGHMYQTLEFVHLPAKAESPSAIAGLVG